MGQVIIYMYDRPMDSRIKYKEKKNQMALFRIFFISLLFVLATAYLFAQQDSSYVVLTNGDKVYGKVERKNPFLSDPYVLLNDSTRYDIKDIRAYENGDGYFAKYGSSFSPSFVKRMFKGKIDYFTDTQWYMTPGNMQTMNTPGGPMTMGTGPMMQAQTIGYFSKNGIDVLEADYSNLRDALADNPQCMEYLDDYSTLRTWQWALAGSAVVAVIAGVASMEEGMRQPPALVFVGAGLGASSWIISFVKSPKLQLAIKAYNN